MSQRPGFLVDYRISAKGRWPATKSPNQQADVISTEIRCHWPYLAPREEIERALTAVYAEAMSEVEKRFEG